MEDVTPQIDENMNDDYYEELTLDDMPGLESPAGKIGSKPVFENNTLATITEVRMKKSKQPQYTRDGESTYYPVIVTIVTETEDGLVSFDNYGGLRLTSDDNLWAGPKSQLGKLLNLCKAETSINNFKDFFDYLNSGVQVKIRTQISQFQGKEYSKNLIQQIV